MLRLCKHNYLKGVVSHPVLIEAERNIRDKFSPEVVLTYRNLLESVDFINIRVPSPEEGVFGGGIVEKKDEHVLAAVLEAAVPYLITLDQNLKVDINAVDLPVTAFTPGDFIKKVLPRHIDYPEMRNDVD